MDCNSELLMKYLRGDATPKERLRVMEWVKENDDNRKELQAFHRIYDALLISDEDHAARRHGVTRRLLVRIVSAAAAAAVAAGIFFMTGKNWDRQETEVPAVSLCAPVGHQTVTRLSDGTMVRLNSGSTLEILPREENERRVRLEGEGYFDVAHDETRPFVLETGKGLEVKVLGTVFNVTAYDEVQAVVLVEGLVEARTGGTGMVIEPSQRFVYDAQTGEKSVENIDVREYTSWIDGYILLERTSVSDVFRRLEQYYGVSIRLDGTAFGDMKLDGKLMIDGDVFAVLNTVAMMISADVIRISDTEYEVRPQTVD